MSRIGGAIAAAALVVSVGAGAGCDYEGPKPGVQGICSMAAGTPLGCDDAPIETADQACSKLVACNVIPVDDPNPDGAFDYPDCIDAINSLEDFRFDFTLACIEASSCDELNSTGPPLCFEHGDD
jgi:hypothetical protein